jgi:ribosomal protein S8
MVRAYDNFEEAISKDADVALSWSIITNLITVLKEKGFIREFSPVTGDLAKRMLHNLLNPLLCGTELMEFVEPKIQSVRPILEGTDRKLGLIMCLCYNLYIEKIGEVFKLLLDLHKVREALQKSKNSFVAANDIIDFLLKIYPDSTKLFKFADRKLRNSLAHYSFFVHAKGIIYFPNELSDLKNAKMTTIPYYKLIDAIFLLNKVVQVLRQIVEDELKPFEIDKKAFDFLNARIEDSFR